MLLRILSLTLAVLFALASSAALPPAEAKKKPKTVTKTFSNANAIEIQDNTTADPYPSSIQISGLKKGKIKDVNLILRDFSHTFPPDVNVLLVAKDGSNALVMSDVGGLPDANNLKLTLDDEAASGLPNNAELTSGVFRPTNDGPGDMFPDPAPEPSGNVALSVFDGDNPNGQWRLFVVDDSMNDDGEFAGGWSLQITAKVKRKKK
jgi:subtilisin-like proprotein convertase family protein